MTEYDENFITTYTGKKFRYLDPKPEEIDILDIAHALSLSCRFRGQCRVFYSVAEHSIRVAKLVPAQLKLQALLHDAAEAYIPDIPRPMKHSFGMATAEALVLSVILNKFGIDGISPLVKKADNVLIATEARDLMDNMDGWAKLPMPLMEHINPWPWGWTKQIFLEEFHALCP